MLKICIGTYKAYNEGKLGEWIDIADFSDADELRDFLKEKFNENEPEQMVQDAESFADYIGECPNLDELFELEELMNEHEDYVDNGVLDDALEICGSIDRVSEKVDEYIGQREDVENFIYEDACERVERCDDGDKQFFQSLVDTYDWEGEVDVWEANGQIISGSHGNYFWN